MVIKLKKKLKFTELVLPNKRLNYFVGTVLLLGILSGSIFLMISSSGDKKSVMDSISLFFSNVNENKINSGLAFRNSLIINYLFIFIVFICGLSMIGVFFNIFILYLKGFLVGFSISSIFLTYHFKGIVGVLVYVVPSQLINLFLLFLLTVYSLMFSWYLIKMIFFKKGRERSSLKRYFVIFVFCILFSFLSSVLEVYVFPKVLKLFVSFYVK